MHACMCFSPRAVCLPTQSSKAHVVVRVCVSHSSISHNLLAVVSSPDMFVAVVHLSTRAWLPVRTCSVRVRRSMRTHMIFLCTYLHVGMHECTRIRSILHVPTRALRITFDHTTHEINSHVVSSE
jgi:hypothetical protein